MKENLLLNQEISENSKLIEDIAFNISKEFTQELDKVMGTCKSIFQSKDKITNQEIEDLLAQLPSILYFVNEGQEAVGIKQDIAEMTKKANYNIAREKANGTVADKNTTAESQVINEAINEIIYQRAYKLIRAKIEMAQEMINSLKRIFDARMMEYQIGNGVRR
jgi:hypothetical protein